MKTLNVPDMNCQNCVRKIGDALGKADVKHEISLEDKTVSIDGCDRCLAKAFDIIRDLGFTPEKTDRQELF